MLTGSQTNPLVERLMNIARAQIEAQAMALKISALSAGDMDQMLSHAKGRLAQLSPMELSRIGTGHTVLAKIAAESFGIVAGSTDPDALRARFAVGAAAQKDGGAHERTDGKTLTSLQRQIESYGATREGTKAGTGYSAELGTKEIMANRELARALGMGWAAETDLMRLPRHELIALADSRITAPTYHGLRGLKYDDKGIVAMAEFAKKHKLDINKMYEKQKEYGEIIGNGDPKKAEEYHRAIQQFFLDKKAGRTDAEERFRRTTAPLATDDKGRKALEDTERLLKMKQEQLEKDQRKDAAEKLKAGDEKLKTADSFDALYDAGSTPAAAKPVDPKKADIPAASDTLKTASATPAAKPEAKSATPDRPKTTTAAVIPKGPTPAA